MNEVINTADMLAQKSPWAWVLASFVGWIIATFLMIRYMTTKRDDTIDKLVASEREKVDLVMKSQADLNALYKEHSAKYEALAEKSVTVQHEIAQALQSLREYVRK